MTSSSSDASLRRVVIMTETPESKQPFSMMHRALYANIVGHETMYTFPHGCTIKQYNGVDFIVDHVTRLARPVSSVPALTAHEHENIKKANEYQNGISKCRAVLSNLQSRFKIAHNQLAKSAAVVERHEATLRSIQERKAAMASSSPIANVIAQRCQDLTTVRALLSLVAQALRAASAEHVRFLKPHQLADLERVAPPLYHKYMAWKSGELQLLEKGEQPPGAQPNNAAEAEALEREETNPFEGLEGEDELPADEDDEDVTDGASEDDGEGEQSDADGGDSNDPRIDGERREDDATPTSDPDMDDEIVLPGSSRAHGLDSGNTNTGKYAENNATVERQAESTSSTSFLKEDVAKMDVVCAQEVQAEGAAAAAAAAAGAGALVDVKNDALAAPATGSAEDPTATPTTVVVEGGDTSSSMKTQRNRDDPEGSSESTLYLPDCTQPSISIYCAPCHAYIVYSAVQLAAHAACEEHRRHVSGEAKSGGQPLLATSVSPTPLPPYVTHRPIPKRHVRLEEDNNFGKYFTIVRSGCSSCRKDVELDDLMAHGSTQEHLDFLDE